MSIFAHGRYWRSSVMLTVLLLLSACHSLSGGRYQSVDIEQMMPGEHARARYAYMVAAIQGMDVALAGQNAFLGDIPLDVSLHGISQNAESIDTDERAHYLRRVAEREVLAHGPYRLVQADTLGGRLEYRSERTSEHVSVIVRAPDARERADGRSYIVTNMFGQVSLAERMHQAMRDETSEIENSASPTLESSLLKTEFRSTSDDSATLAHFESWPAAERDREDLLGLQAMLLMRLDQDDKARLLVEKGMVRYPHSPLFFTLAGLLFERSDRATTGSAIESLKSIMQERFGQRKSDASRRAAEGFLSGNERS